MERIVIRTRVFMLILILFNFIAVPVLGEIRGVSLMPLKYLVFSHLSWIVNIILYAFYHDFEILLQFFQFLVDSKVNQLYFGFICILFLPRQLLDIFFHP